MPIFQTFMKSTLAVNVNDANKYVPIFHFQNQNINPKIFKVDLNGNILPPNFFNSHFYQYIEINWILSMCSNSIEMQRLQIYIRDSL